VLFVDVFVLADELPSRSVQYFVSQVTSLPDVCSGESDSRGVVGDAFVEEIRSLSEAANIWDEVTILDGEPIKPGIDYHFDSPTVFLDQFNEENSRGYGHLFRIKWDDGTHAAGDLCCAYAGRDRRTQRPTFVADSTGTKDHRRSKTHKTRSKRVDCRHHHRLVMCKRRGSTPGVTVTFTRTIIFTHNNHPRYLGPKIANLTKKVREELIQDSVEYGFSAPTLRKVLQKKAGGIIPDTTLKSLRRNVKKEKLKQQLEQSIEHITNIDLTQEILQQVRASA
jgi:hypothetical protein